MSDKSRPFLSRKWIIRGTFNSQQSTNTHVYIHKNHYSQQSIGTHMKFAHFRAWKTVLINEILCAQVVHLLNGTISPNTPHLFLPRIIQTANYPRRDLSDIHCTWVKKPFLSTTIIQHAEIQYLKNFREFLVTSYTHILLCLNSLMVSNFDTSIWCHFYFWPIIFLLW